MEKKNYWPQSWAAVSFYQGSCGILFILSKLKVTYNQTEAICIAHAYWCKCKTLHLYGAFSASSWAVGHSSVTYPPAPPPQQIGENSVLVVLTKHSVGYTLFSLFWPPSFRTISYFIDLWHVFIISDIANRKEVQSLRRKWWKYIPG